MVVMSSSSSRLTTRSLAAAVAQHQQEQQQQQQQSQQESEADEEETLSLVEDTLDSLSNASNLVIITTNTSKQQQQQGDCNITQPTAVMTAAAALGMNLNATQAAAASVEPSDNESNTVTVNMGSVGCDSGDSGATLLTRGRALKSRQHSSSDASQASRRQVTDSRSAAVAATATEEETATTATTTNKTTSAATPTKTGATPTNTADHPQEESEDTTSEKMIDTSDFRMVDPGCSYMTLAAAAAANGRMTPPNHHQGHASHHIHHSHAMASYVNTSYTTLTPLQPLPPISTISNMQEKFQHYSPSGGAGADNNGATPTHVSDAGGPAGPLVSNFVMQNNLSPYMSMSPHHYSVGGAHGAAAAAAMAMGAHSPPHGGEGHHYPHNGGGGIHSKQEPMSPNSYYAEAQRPSPNHHDMSPHSLDHSPTGGSNGGGAGQPMVPITSSYDALTSNNNPSLNGGMTSPHTISPGPHNSPLLHHREMSPPSPPPTSHHGNGASILAAAAASALGHHNQHGQHGLDMGMHNATPTMVTLKSTPTSNNNNSSGPSGEAEEINTKDLAQRISAELKRYSIPQAIFAQRVLCRSQGTLSDLLRNPKPWSKLKSGRETFRRMQKWLQEPEFQRMSALRLAGKVRFYFIKSIEISPFRPFFRYFLRYFVDILVYFWVLILRNSISKKLQY
jgi:hypothetical protein